MIQPTVGILGGGQLARMLTLAAHPLGLNVACLAAHPQDPAAQVCGPDHLRVGALTDETALKKFLTPLRALTFESEFVDTGLVERHVPPHCHVFPSLDVLATIQDRLTQKRLLDRFKIPTSPWCEVSTEADLKRAAQLFPRGFVLKQRRFGYDGYGTFVVKNTRRELDTHLLRQSTGGFIAERFIPFQRELATVFVRSRTGDFLSLPLVESVQQDARCFSVHGPVRHRGLERLTSAFKRLMTELDYQGVLAVELFATAQGLMVNELAPRVHNSAHHSLDALTCSQFEYHLRAGLGLPLPPVQLVRPGFAMVNLLGGGKESIRLSWSNKGHLHWYGKRENRPGRKLGHLNVVGSSPTQALKVALRWRKDFEI